MAKRAAASPRVRCERVAQPRVLGRDPDLNQPMLMPLNLPHSLLPPVRRDAARRAILASGRGLFLDRRLSGADIDPHSTTSAHRENYRGCVRLSLAEGLPLCALAGERDAAAGLVAYRGVA